MKNVVRVENGSMIFGQGGSGDVIQNPIDRESYEDAVSLEDGIYPITTDDNTIISSDMVSYGSGTVEDALDEMKIEFATVSGTTDTNALLTTTIPTASIFVLSARYEGGTDGGVIPMTFSKYNVWVFECEDLLAAKLSNTAVTIRYAYMRI